MAALEHLLLRVARLACDVAVVPELGLNPVIVAPGGVSVLRATARLDADPRRTW